MYIEHLRVNFEKRQRKIGLIYTLGAPASIEEIKCAEKRLSVTFYEQLAMFYRYCNGLVVKKPQIEIYPLERLVKENHRIYFATINSTCTLCFDCKEFNSAHQWNIINSRDSYIITLTFASFWSNKVWAWIDKERAIWKPAEETL